MTGPVSQPRKPVILTVDDDPAVSRAVARDLRRHYGERYRIVRAESGPDALETINELKLRGDTVAVFVADYRMPGMSGIEFLEDAMDIYPLARRVLLTAYADTHAAIDAINVVDLDHYLLKPWDPPEEKLYPVIDGLLEAWRAQGDRAVPVTKVIGHRWNPRSWEVRQFLARNQHSFRSYMADESKGKQLLDAAGLDGLQLPVVITEGGETLVEPTNTELADMLGLSTSPSLEMYELAVIGGGPAGLAAAVYGASEGLKTVLIESTTTGGQAGRSSRIENYLGFPTGISGAELTTSARRQAERFGAEVITTRKAVGLEVSGQARTIEFEDGSTIGAQAVILATGVDYRHLQAPGCWDNPDDRDACNYIGRGVYYGASVSDASDCEGEDVYIVGGANSAGQAAMFMSKTAKSVTLLVRGPSLAASMSYYLIQQIEEKENIHVRTCTEVVEALGEDDHLTGLVVENRQTGERETVTASRMCCFIGATPRTKWLDGIVARDDRGFILTGPDLKDVCGWTLDRPPHHLETSVPGVFVAGDVRADSAKRVAAAVGEGSMAVMLVHRYLAEA
ncbi:FAD-dependent oxidoreductase [Mycobacterium sp. ITM-2016-00318]|uniref:FAD-dependent oxidoreductase n=1 Tax=Mycobacterium sp. ITM-2016-00318 TaxID=2099693 RepID=UPI00287F6115|nr:FAD-dependent oxidoreductase [Mycobacterium sp. ITM-2016-00318]WNG93940.1 FAD-dependent oxidoreductase [Mycobacterium sp. ITM-2016-00318]